MHMRYTNMRAERQRESECVRVLCTLLYDGTDFCSWEHRQSAAFDAPCTGWVGQTVLLWLHSTRHLKP